jgi:PAS domain S-box-containing protein
MAQNKAGDEKSGDGSAQERSATRAGGLPFLSRSSHEEIVQRLMAENRALGRRREELAAVVAEAVIDLDGQLTITGWNQAAAHIFGWQADEVTGKTLGEVLDTRLPGGRAWAECLAEMAGQDSWEGELIQAGRGGVKATMAARAVFGRDEGGALKGVTLVCHDRRAQRLLEEKSDLSEREFQALAESLPELVWLGDEHGRTYWYNRRWYDYTGTNFEEMKGPGWQKVHDPGYLPRLLERTARALKEGQPWEDVFPLRGKDGKFRLFYTRAVPLHNREGRVVRWVGTNTDINELREAQQAVREGETRYQGLLDALGEGYISGEVVSGPGGSPADLRITAVNRAFEKITGASAAAVIGQTFKGLFPAETPALLEYLAQSAAQNRPWPFMWDSKAYGRRFMATAYLPSPATAVILFRE